MIDRPFDQVRETFKENNLRNKELLKFVFEKSDGLSLWVIGLSISGISLLVGNIANLKKTVPPVQLSHILILLSISVITGIIYRVIFLSWFVVQNHISDSIDIALTKKEQMHQKSFLNGTETYQELILIVEDGTGNDYSNLITLYNESDEFGKKVLYDSMVAHYLKNIEFAVKDYELALNFVIETYSKFSGISKQKYLKHAESKRLGSISKWLTFFLRLFYILFMVSFMTALCVFAMTA